MVEAKHQDSDELDDTASTTTPADQVKAQTRLNPGKAFFGLLLIIIGALALLDSTGAAEVRFANLWRLWPLALVGVGLSVLSLRNRFSQLLTWLFVLVVLSAVIVVSLTDVWGPPATTRSQFSLPIAAEAVQAEVNFAGGAGDLELLATDEPVIASAELLSRFAVLRHDSHLKDGVQAVDLDMDSDGMNWLGHWRNELELALGVELPLELELETGASRLRGDLSALDLRRLVLKTGASSVDLRLGSRAPLSQITLEAGASSITLAVPQTSGVRINLSSGLGSVSAADLEEISEGVYATADFATAEQRIDISGNLGAASFRLERY